MHCKADHFHFSLELDLSSSGIAIFKPLDSHNGPILENSFVHISKATLSKYAFATEVVCCNLKLPEMESLQVSKGNLFVMPV